MTANFLGLFLLILAGISNVFPFSFLDEMNIKDDYYPWLKDYGNRKSSDYKSLHDFPYGNYFRSLRLKNRGVLFDTHEFNPFGRVREASSSDRLKNPTPSDIYSIPDTGSTVSDLSMASQKMSDIKDAPETGKDVPNTEKTSNSENFQSEYKPILQFHPESSSLAGAESTDFTDEKSALTTLKISSKVGTIEPSMKNKESKSASEFLADTFTKNDGTESSVIEKKQNRINNLFFPTRDLVTSYTSTLETIEESECKYHSTKISSAQELFKKLNEADVQAESTMLQDSSSLKTTELTSLDDKSSFSYNTESTNNEKSGVTINEGKFKRESTIFQDPSSTTRKIITLNDKSSSLINMETTYSKDSKLESTVTQTPSLLTTDDYTSSGIKSSSSDTIYSTNIENFSSETTASQSSSSKTHDDTTLQSEISSSFETKSTNAETLETEPITENYISSRKYVSISYTDKVTEERPKEIITTESHYPTSTTSSSVKNLVIEISSIHTARIVITSAFLVIALTALTVLAVYMFTLRRRTVHYDQLQLIS